MAIYQGNKKVGYNIDTTVYSTCPIGTILSYGGSSIPSGYLLCDGSEISKETYKDLYEIIGDTYGTSTDNTKFKLPNLRDKFIQGANNNLGTNKDAGLPNITGEFYQDANADTTASGAFIYKSGGSLNLANSTTATSGFIALDASRSNPIYGNSDTVQPPSICMNYIIKALNVGESGSSSEVINDNATSKTTTYSSDKIDTTYVKKEEGKSLVENTEISKIHEHNNKAYLDKLGENESGKPTYNGEEIGTGGSGANIDDENISTDTTYSSEKIEGKFVGEIEGYTDDELKAMLGLSEDDKDLIKNLITDDSVIDTTKTWNSSVLNEKFNNIHTHSNKDDLDKLGHDDNGNLTYNGKEVSNLSNCYNKTESEEKFAEKNHNHDTIYRKISDSYSKTEIDDKGFLTEHQDISGKQDKLKVGDNITISEDNTISATGVTVDSELSDTSENPVQNKVIKARLDEVFQSGSNGKNTLETTITAKGGVVSKAGDVATFEELNNGIEGIPSSVCDLNIFTQTTEPTKKKGLWLNTNNIFNKIENYAEATYDNFAQELVQLGYNNGLAFQYSKSCQVGKYCYIIGGNYHTKRNFRYNMETKETATLAEIPMSFESGTVCTDGTYIYIMCAYSDHKTNYKYNIATDTYTTLPNGVKIDRPSSQYLNNKIYIFGNDDGSCYTYDLLTNTATRMANITYGSMINNRSIIIGNYIYIMFDYTKTGALYRYDTTTSTLTTLLNSPFKLDGTNIGLFEKNGYIYEFGYDNTGTDNSAVNVIYRYDIKNNSYKKLDKTTANNTVVSSVHSYCFYNNTFTCFNDTYTSYSTFGLNKNCLYLDKSEETNSALLVETPYDYLNKEEKFKNCFLTDNDSAIITCDSYIGNGTTWNKIN